MAICLGIAVLLLVILPTTSWARDATGHFEVYCNGKGFFLERVDGARAPGKLVLYLPTPSLGIPFVLVPKEEWLDVHVYGDGCTLDGKCELLANGKIELSKISSDERRVSGRYELELGGKHLHGQFAVAVRRHKGPPEICE
jgi:hypothetical protein